MDEAYRSSSFSAVSTIDAWEMPSEDSSVRLLTISGKRKPRRPQAGAREETP